jgi:L-threo-3-deoxy-hexylosonate aldolase
MANYYTAEYALNKLYGYGIAPRKPLLPLKEAEGEAFMEIQREMIDLEAEYARK